MKRSILLSILILFASIQVGRAQRAYPESRGTLSGVVTDRSGEPIPAVSLYLLPQERGAATDAEGRFEIKDLASGETRLRASYVGYRTVEMDVEVEPGERTDLRIELESEELGFGRDVVVTATRTEQAVATAPASISVVSSRLLEQESVADLTDVLRNIPGVSLTASSQGRRTIQLRGMDSSHTLMLIDGRRVNSSEAVFRHNDYDIGMLPLEAIDRIEVVRGGMSALYGSEALGGVINVITKPYSNGWNAKVSSEVQTPTEGDGGEEIRTSVYTSGALVKDRLGVTLTGTLNHREIWHGWADEPLLESDGTAVTRPDGSEVSRSDLATLEGRNDHNGRAKLTWAAAERQTVEVEGGRALQTREGEYYIRGWGEADTRMVRDDLVLTHRGAYSWGESEIRGYSEWIETESDDLRQANQVVEGHASLPLARHLLTMGGEAQWIDLDAPGAFTSGGASVHQQALYIQDEWQMSERFKALLGTRMDHHEDFGFKWTPRAYLVYSASDRWVVKGGVGTGFRAPTLRQLSEESVTASCRGGCLIVGDPDLNPETSINYELSLNYTGDILGGSVTAFQNRVDNLIDTPRGSGVPSVGIDPETGLEMYVPRNVNEARIQGIETTLSLRTGRTGRLTLNHQWLEARDLSNDEPLQYRPESSLNAQYSWYVTTSGQLFLRGKYIGEQVTSAGTVDPYTLFDLGGSYRLTDRVRLRAGVLNLLNRRTDDSAEEYSFVERARSVYAGMSIEF